MSNGEADRKANELYSGFGARFGADDPRAAGYRSPTAFFRERELVLAVLRRYSGPVLDVGCGGGLVTKPLVPEGRLVVGLDFNSTACMTAARNGLAMIRGDAFKLPFADNSFPVVVATEFLQQYNRDSIQNLVREMARVAVKGGAVVLVWRNGASAMRRLVTLTGVVLNGFKRPSLAVYDHAYATVAGFAEAAGLEVRDAAAIFPPLGLKVEGAESPAARLLTTSFMVSWTKRR